MWSLFISKIAETFFTVDDNDDEVSACSFHGEERWSREFFFLHENSMEKHKKINSLINYPSQPFFAGVGESPFLTKNLIRL